MGSEGVGKVQAVLLAVAAMISLLALVATGAAAAPEARSNAVVEIKLKNFVFAPADIKANVGDTIKFTNEDAACHTVTRGTPANGPCTGSNSTAESSFDVVLDGAGKSTQVTVNTEGSFEIYCKPHGPTMKATVTVSKPAAPPAQRTPGFEAVAAFAGIAGAAGLVAVISARRRRSEDRDRP
jgi:plastocyanin